MTSAPRARPARNHVWLCQLTSLTRRYGDGAILSHSQAVKAACCFSFLTSRFLFSLWLLLTSQGRPLLRSRQQNIRRGLRRQLATTSNAKAKPWTLKLGLQAMVQSHPSPLPLNLYLLTVLSPIYTRWRQYCPPRRLRTPHPLHPAPKSRTMMVAATSVLRKGWYSLAGVGRPTYPGRSSSK
jgi:hypothetical protein